MGILSISLFAWLYSLRRLRLVRDTPTSKIASAAQGYVELIGRGKPLPGVTLLSRQYGLPCLWHRYRIQRKTGNDKLETVQTGESHEPFLLDDGSGRSCIIDPSGAEILTMHEESWWEDNYYFHTEWKLLDIDTLYAVGQFRTFGGSNADLSFNNEVRDILAEWKQNMPELRKRFDLNNDGELDMKEWMLARMAAKREAEKRIAAIRSEPDMDYLLQPQDGRLFLISNLPQNKMEQRYLYWTWVYLAIFLGALTGFGWVYARGF